MDFAAKPMITITKTAGTPLEIKVSKKNLVSDVVSTPRFTDAIGKALCSTVGSRAAGASTLFTLLCAIGEKGTKPSTKDID
jgi:hypothetical protein